MSNLGDYLGQLMSEIAMARMQADLETIRLAELYASHPLLRHLPVPHIRVPDVDLDVPVLIKDAQPPRPGEGPRGGVPQEQLRSAFDALLNEQLQQSKAKLSATTAARLKAALDARDQARLRLPLWIDVNRAADEYTATAADVLKEVQTPARRGVPPEAAIDAAALKDRVRQAFLQLRTEPPRLDVIVTSAEIREGATPDNLARIRLKITEQGVEWATIRSNGESRDLLVPE